MSKLVDRCRLAGEKGWNRRPCPEISSSDKAKKTARAGKSIEPEKHRKNKNTGKKIPHRQKSGTVKGRKSAGVIIF